MSTGDSAARTDDWTVQKILQWTTGYLKEKGIESPRLEAELLLAHARECPRIRLYTDFEDVVTEKHRTRMREFVQRRAAREPLAYITGSREFYGRNFSVGSGVLIPRPETETLIDVCLERLPEQRELLVAEVGFGSGCIAATLACQRPLLRVIASDISEAAMDYATRNTARLKVQDRVTLLAGRELLPMQSGSAQPFDAVISNPPYVRADELEGLQPEIRLHEPSEALIAGDDGLDVVRDIITQSAALLGLGGFLAMELDPAQCPLVVALLEAHGFRDGQIRKDLCGMDRIVLAEWQGLS